MKINKSKVIKAIIVLTVYAWSFKLANDPIMWASMLFLIFGTHLESRWFGDW